MSGRPHVPSRRRRALFALALALVLSPSTPPLHAAQDAAFKVVVHAANPATSLSKTDVTKLFLKKTRAWPGGAPAVPVDLEDKAPARKAFSQQVLGKDVGATKAYWQQLIFTGKGVPPVEKTGDAEVLAFVAANPGAIGYVSSGAAIGGGVKVLKLEP